MRQCEICGQEIHADRLECVPDTVLCITHAKAAQQFGGEFITRGVQHNIGKAGSLKKNYGDVEVIRRRNQTCILKLKQQFDAAREAQHEIKQEE